MYMRIVWGKIIPGKWDEFEAAFNKGLEAGSTPSGLVKRWLSRDTADHEAGYSITMWNTEAEMKAFWDSKDHKVLMDLIKPFFANQYTVTDCEVRLQR
jgi:heme-degrading monooxygenase HmoA